MEDEELIGYCEIHCQTPRALFNSQQINRMLVLAGHPKGYPKEIEPNRWVTVHADMEDLCKIARKRLAISKQLVGAQSNVVSIHSGQST